AGLAFGNGHGAGVAELEEALRREQAEHASHLSEAAAEIERLRAEADELRAQIADDTENEEEHRIAMPEGTWKRPNVWLFLLAAWSGVAPFLPWWAMPAIGVVSLGLFTAWSTVQFRRRGLWQLLLKWLVWVSVIGASFAVFDFEGMPNHSFPYV